MKRGKKYLEAAKKIDKAKAYSLEEAVKLAQEKAAKEAQKKVDKDRNKKKSGSIKYTIESVIGDATK